MSNKAITSLQDLQSYAQGQIVELPPFGEGQPFVARLGRPSILELVKNGSIPNSLLTTANKLFVNNQMDVNENNMLSDVFKVIESLCQATFLEPTYDQIKGAGVSLTDEQMMFVFYYTQKGIQALESFRIQQANTGTTGAGSKVPHKAIGTAGH